MNAVKTWTTNEKLTSTDLNTEFSNVYTNAVDKGTAQTITGVKTFDDDTNLVFGAGTDYWFVYDSSNTQFELNTTNKGGGADGIVFSVADGTDDLTFTGDLSIDGTTDTSSTTTGSIHTDGGVGIAKALWVGTTSRFVGVTTHGGNVVSDTDSTDDLGTTSVRWANLFVDDITLTTTLTAGTSLVAGTLTLAGGSITDSSAAISFGDENLSTTGTLGAGATTVTDLTSTGNTTIGNATGDALTFHPSAWTLTNAVSITGTWTDLGTVTTADINGGTVDGAIVGGASAAAGTFTTLAGTTSVVANSDLTLTSGSIISASGSITFGDENLSTTGTLASGNLGVTGTITGSGVLSIDDTTDSTSGTTGSIHTDGGLGVAKNVYISEELHLLDSKAVKFGTGEDASISFDGTDLLITPNVVGNGTVVVQGNTSNSTLEMPGNGASGVMTAFVYSADNVSLMWDAYYSSGFKSADAGSSFAAYKVGDKLSFQYDTADVGAAVSWNEALNILSTGNVELKNDLLLPSGGVINWNAGDVTLTHSAGALTQTVAAGATFSLTTGAGKLSLATDSSDNGYLSTDGAKPIIFRTGNTEALRIDSSQNVGIGVTPNNRFHIQNSGTAAYAIQVDASDGSDLFGVWEEADGTGIVYLRDAAGDPQVVLDSGGNSYVTGGNLGIGTSSPTYKLHVDHDATTRKKVAFVNSNTGADVSSGIELLASTGGRTATDGIYIEAGDTGQSGMTDTEVMWSNTANGLWLGTSHASGDLHFFTGGLTSANERMTIVDSGNVGIGTSSPDGTLHVHTATAGSVTAHGSGDDLVIESSTSPGMSFLSPNDQTAGIYFGDPESNIDGQFFYSHVNRAFTWYTAGAKSMTMDSAGSLLINETANANQTIGLTINQGANDDEAFALKSSDISHPFTNQTEADTYGTLRKFQDTSGGFAIAGYKTSAGVAGGAIALLGRLGEAADTTKSTAARGVIEANATVTDGGTSTDAVGADGNLFTIENNDAARFIFDAEGSGHADVEWTTYSDRRLKSNIETIPYGLKEINALDALVFDKQSGAYEDGELVLEDNKRRMLGFIAQDAKALMPELVKDVDETTSFYSLDYGRFTPVLWRGVQELHAELTDTKDRLAKAEAAIMKSHLDLLTRIQALEN